MRDLRSLLIEVSAPGSRPTRYHFPWQTLRLGRLGSADIFLPHSTVARLHALIECLPGQPPSLHDLRSTNGVYVNGLRVQRQPLTDGDIIQIGPFSIRVSFGAQLPGSPSLLARLYLDGHLAEERALLPEGLSLLASTSLRPGPIPDETSLSLHPSAGGVMLRGLLSQQVFVDGAPHVMGVYVRPGSQIYLGRVRIHVLHERALSPGARPLTLRGAALAEGPLPVYARGRLFSHGGEHPTPAVLGSAAFWRDFSLEAATGHVTISFGRQPLVHGRATLLRAPAPDAAPLLVPVRQWAQRGWSYAEGEVLLPGDEVEVRGVVLEESFLPETGGPRQEPARRVTRVLADRVAWVPPARAPLLSRLRRWLYR